MACIVLDRNTPGRMVLNEERLLSTPSQTWSDATASSVLDRLGLEICSSYPLAWARTSFLPSPALRMPLGGSASRGLPGAAHWTTPFWKAVSMLRF